jgi:hypothetical protein
MHRDRQSTGAPATPIWQGRADTTFVIHFGIDVGYAKAG